MDKVQFVYGDSKLPSDRSHVDRVNDAANRLVAKLRNVDFQSLNISDYSKRYNKDNFKKFRFIIQANAFNLLWTIDTLQRDPQNISLLDSPLPLVVLATALIYKDFYTFFPIVC